MSTTMLFCHVMVAPMRADQSDASEMVSQLLFGEGAAEIERTESWVKIRSLHDDYEGWIDTKQVWEISIDEWEFWLNNTRISTHRNLPFFLSGTKAYTLIGGRIPKVSIQLQMKENVLEFGAKQHEIQSGLELAKELFNTPYLWGGRSSNGIDCSGLTQLCYSVEDIKLPRDASLQVQLGIEIPFLDRKPGDLCFFINPKGKVHHVGIVSESGNVYHAHGWVREDDLTVKGIVRRTDGKLSHELFCIKRL